MKYYAVTKGEYSDYHIITITSNKDKAELIAEKYSDKYHNTEVEEYEELDLSDNRLIYDARLYFDKSILEISNGREPNEYDINKEFNCVYKGGYFLKVGVKAHNKEQARKIASDLFAEYRAKEEGIA